MSRFDQFATNLGNQSAPFGPMPGYDPRQAGINMIGSMGMNMLANSTANPMEALGRGYQQAQQQNQDQQYRALQAQEMMQNMDERKRKAAQENTAIQSQLEQQDHMKTTVDGFLANPPHGFDVSALSNAKLFARSGMYDKAIEALTGAGGGADEYGLNVFWAKNPVTGETQGFQPSKKGGKAKPIDLPPGMKGMDPGALAEDRAAGTLAGNAPKAVIDEYVTKIRPQMQATVEALSAVQQAKAIMSRGIQTGSMADQIQAMRSLGAQLGFDVDERILSDTQAYQNFIGNIVIPKMQQLGGNDSNEEMRYMRSLSGGDISQAPQALQLMLDYTDKLLNGRMKSYQEYENTAHQYLPGMQPVQPAMPSSKSTKGGWTVEQIE